MIANQSIWAVLSAVLATSTLGSPVKRSGPYPYDDCETYVTGILGVRSDGYQPPQNAGILAGVTHAGIDGQQAKIIVTRNDDGSEIHSQEWEFARCSSITEFDGEKVGMDNTYIRSFGLLRPSGATQHCAAYEYTDGPAKRSVVDSYCDHIKPEYRTWTLLEDQSGKDPVHTRLQMSGHSAVIGDTAHKELQFFADPPASAQTVIIGI